jgi:WD40 repeat protein
LEIAEAKYVKDELIMIITKRPNPLVLLFNVGGVILLFITLLSPRVLAPIVAQGTPDIIREFAWKPDGSVLAVGHDDGTIDIRNSNTGIIEQTLAGGHVGGIIALAWHPTGNRLLSVSADRLVLWDLATGDSYEMQSSFWPTEITWNDDGSRIYGFDESSRLTWDAQTTPPQFLSRAWNDTWFYDIAWSPDRSQIATTVLGNIILRNPSTFEWNAVIDNGGDGSLAWSPDGQWLAASDWLSAIRIWNVASGDFQQERLIQPALFDTPTLDDPLSDIVALSFDANGGELLSVAGTGVFTRWDVTTGQALQVSQLPDALIWAAKFSPDGTQLAYGSQNGALELMEITPTNIAPQANAGPDQTVTASSGGTASVTLDGSGSSDSDGTITAYHWYENDTLIAEGVTPQVELGVGAHTITLTVEDDDGATDSDEVMITVAPYPSNLPFFDGFEDGTGNWTIEGAWTRTNAGHHTGSWSMRIVTPPFGNHNLVLNETLNLAGTTAPQLTYWTRYTLAATQSAYVEVSTDNGATWMWLLLNTNSTKTQWTEKSINLSAYAGQSIKLRFRLSYPYYPNLPQPEWWIDDVQVAETAP